jgi:hypothetical protein
MQIGLYERSIRLMHVRLDRWESVYSPTRYDSGHPDALSIHTYIPLSVRALTLPPHHRMLTSNSLDIP